MSEPVHAKKCPKSCTFAFLSSPHSSAAGTLHVAVFRPDPFGPPVADALRAAAIPAHWALSPRCCLVAEAVLPLEHLICLQGSDSLTAARCSAGGGMRLMAAAFGGHPASADRFKVRLPCLCLMLGEAWDGKYVMQGSCAHVCVAAWHAA